MLEKLAEGNYGVVYKDLDSGHVVKVLKFGKTWGRYEIDLGKRMGELGFSPKVYSATPSHIEMEFYAGAPLWSGGYNRSDDEKERDVKMSLEQAKKALRAIRALHELGFYHGDLHNGQFLTDGEGGTECVLIDFGLSGRISSQPHKAIVDFNKTWKLIGIDRPELDNDPFVQLVRHSVSAYKAAKGESRAAVAKRAQIALHYTGGLAALDK